MSDKGEGDAFYDAILKPAVDKLKEMIAEDAERERRESMRQAERDLMEFYTNPADYIAACDAVKFPAAKPDPLAEHGETFARLIGR